MAKRKVVPVDRERKVMLIAARAEIRKMLAGVRRSVRPEERARFDRCVKALLAFFPRGRRRPSREFEIATRHLLEDLTDSGSGAKRKEG